MRGRLLAAVPLLALASPVLGATIDFEKDSGAVAGDASSATQLTNGGILNKTLAALKKGDVLVVPNKTFHLMGGVMVKGLKSVAIQIDGTLSFSDDIKHWPTNGHGSQGTTKKHDVLECLYFEDCDGLTFTSSGKGTLLGNGGKWWGTPGIGYLTRGENRPRILNIANSKNILVEKLFMKDSPYWTFWAHGVDGLEVRHCDIEAKRTNLTGHSIVDLTAFNTDGFDVTGKNVWIHDVTVDNQDDCVAVKDGSQDMLIERVRASGIGLTIGSIGSSTVKNITFRDSVVQNSFKGIYMKFRYETSPGLISDVTYENIVINNASQWPIWIGPAQQIDSDNGCSILWPDTPGTKCPMSAAGTYDGITLRNITINNPQKSPGVILGNPANPMRNVVFDGVKVNNPGMSPWGVRYYDCAAVGGTAKGDTFPVPPCFKDDTGAACGKDGDCLVAGRTCCSTRSHGTLGCDSKFRCGCVAANDCVDNVQDCCSGKGHKTAKCSLGIGFRCD